MDGLAQAWDRDFGGITSGVDSSLLRPPQKTMPPNTIMHGGTLPLSLPFRSSPPSPTPAQFTQTLLLDSTRLLAGLLRSAAAVEYAIATSGSTTVITQPEQSRNVAVVKWKERIVECNGLRMQFGEWMKVGKWSGSKTHTFKKWGRNPEIKWTARGAEWEARTAKNQVLASFILRRGALGTRLEFTAMGEEYADAVVVTGLLSVTGEQEWMWYGYLRERMEAARRNPEAQGVAREDEGEGVDGQAEGLPTYREAPFTRPLGPVLEPTLASSSETDAFGPPTDNPINLTLSSRQLLSGTFCEEDQPVVSIRTTGPATTIKWFGRVVGSVKWAAGRVELDGEIAAIDDIIGKKSLFKTKKSHTCVFSNLSFTWSETSRTSTASIYPDPDAHVRYACRTVSTNRPLGVFTHYTRKGSLLELTPEGHAALAEVLVGLLLGLCRGEWKRVAGVGVAMSGPGEAGELVVGEEMVSDLDGWAGPVELMQLRRETPQVG